MLSLRAHALISGGLFALLIGAAIGGNLLEGAGVKPPQNALPLIAGGFFLLLIAFGFSFVPVMVKLVLRAQQKKGNGDKTVIKLLLSAENVIIWVMWGLMAAGLAIAIPAAIIDGLFSDLGSPDAAPGQIAPNPTPDAGAP